MSQIPAGWYPDPAPAQPGQPPLLRYWDGRVWTEHTSPATAPAPAYTPAYPPTYAAPGPVPGLAPATPTGPTTADGARLASWWARVGAYLIDSLAIGALSQVLTFPATIGLQSDLDDLGNRWEGRLNGDETFDELRPLFEDLLDVFTDRIWWLVLPSLIATMLYFVGLWRWRGATLGQLALGLKVRHPDHDENGLPIGRGLVRWFVISGVGIVAVLALTMSFIAFVAVSGVVAVFGLLNFVWPLWDPRRQALHDKAARTVVVKIR